MVDVLQPASLILTTPVEVLPAAQEDDLTNLLDECDQAMQGEDIDAIIAGYGETSVISCEDVYFTLTALAHERQTVGRKRIR